jgi:hypothetical protein
MSSRGGSLLDRLSPTTVRANEIRWRTGLMIELLSRRLM